MVTTGRKQMNYHWFVERFIASSKDIEMVGARDIEQNRNQKELECFQAVTSNQSGMTFIILSVQRNLKWVSFKIYMLLSPDAQGYI